MSAEIIQFILRPNRDREQADFPTIAFRSVVRSDDLTMDHADTSPCEYISPDECNPESSEFRGMPQAANSRQNSAVNGGEPRADESKAREMSGIEMLSQSKHAHGNRAHGYQERD
jgi:hypothetical protein